MVVCKALPGAPKLLTTPIFHDFFSIFPVFPGTSGRVPWIPGVQTLKMGERWGKMGKQRVKNEITGLQKTAQGAKLWTLQVPTDRYSMIRDVRQPAATSAADSAAVECGAEGAEGSRCSERSSGMSDLPSC